MRYNSQYMIVTAAFWEDIFDTSRFLDDDYLCRRRSSCLATVWLLTNIVNMTSKQRQACRRNHCCNVMTTSDKQGDVKFISTQHSCLSDNTDTFILVDTWTRHNQTLHCCDKRAISYRNSHSTGNCTSTNTSTYACARVRVGIWMITLSAQEAGHHEVDRHILDCSIWHFMVVHGYKWRHYRSLKWRHYRSLKCAYDGVIIS